MVPIAEPTNHANGSDTQYKRKHAAFNPARAYGAMDFESRNLYRQQVANIAKHSDFSELDVAKTVVALAEEATRNTYEEPRTAVRESHVGYYLMDEGTHLLHQKAAVPSTFWSEDSGTACVNIPMNFS